MIAVEQTGSILSITVTNFFHDSILVTIVPFVLGCSFLFVGIKKIPLYPGRNPKKKPIPRIVPFLLSILFFIFMLHQLFFQTHTVIQANRDSQTMTISTISLANQTKRIIPFHDIQTITFQKNGSARGGDRYTVFATLRWHEIVSLDPEDVLAPQQVFIEKDNSLKLAQFLQVPFQQIDLGNR